MQQTTTRQETFQNVMNKVGILFDKVGNRVEAFAIYMNKLYTSAFNAVSSGRKKYRVHVAQIAFLLIYIMGMNVFIRQLLESNSLVVWQMDIFEIKYYLYQKAFLYFKSFAAILLINVVAIYYIPKVLSMLLPKKNEEYNEPYLELSRLRSLATQQRLFEIVVTGTGYKMELIPVWKLSNLDDSIKVDTNEGHNQKSVDVSNLKWIVVLDNSTTVSITETTKIKEGMYSNPSPIAI